MYEVLYEISIFDVIWWFLFYLLLSFFTILLTIGAFINHSKLIIKIVLTTISLVFLFAMWTTVYEMFFVDNIYSDYKNGNYKTVVGIIEDYERNEEIELKYEQFTVNNVYFKNSNDVYWGYDVYKSSGHQFKNGDNLRISYVYDELTDKNVIVKLEIKSE